MNGQVPVEFLTVFRDEDSETQQIIYDTTTDDVHRIYNTFNIPDNDKELPFK